MVRFGKRFFFNVVYEKKTRRNTIIGVGSAILVILIGVILVTNKSPKPKPKPKTAPVVLRKSITTEVNSPLPDKTKYFKKLAQLKLDEIELIYPENMPIEISADECPLELISKINDILDGTAKGNLDDFTCIKKVPAQIGEFEVKVKFRDKINSVKVKVKDTIKPVLTLKNVVIDYNEDKNYVIEDFVVECKDNYDKTCLLRYADKSKYDGITASGKHEIIIIASDSSKNETALEDGITTLIISENNKYLVTFDSNGGSNIKGEYVIKGNPIAKPNNPFKNNYTFKGWTLNNQLYDFNTPVNSDITLVATWSENPKPKPQPKPKPKPKPKPYCAYGNKEFDKKKFRITVDANPGSDCAAAYNNQSQNKMKQNSDLKTIEQKETQRLNNDLSRLGYGEVPLNCQIEHLIILNKSGTGVVGYQSTVTIERKINGQIETAVKYVIDSNHKRHFEKNVFGLES